MSRRRFSVLLLFTALLLVAFECLPAMRLGSPSSPVPKYNAPAGKKELPAPTLIAKIAPKATFEPAPVPVASERRFAVGGAQGFSVVISDTGQAFLEDPKGRRTHLADEVVIGKAKQSVNVNEFKEPAPIPGTGQIIVLESGLVEIPKAVTITFLGKDYVVTRRPDGTSYVYHLDGRVEQRKRLMLSDLQKKKKE